MELFHVKGDFMKNVGIKILVVVGLYVPVMFGMDDPNWRKVNFMKRVLTFTKGCVTDTETITSLVLQLKEARELNQIPQNILNMQDDNGDSLLHLLAKVGNTRSFKTAIYFGIPQDIKNGNDQTVVDVLNEEMLEAQKTADVEKLTALGECFSAYRSIYLKPLYCLVPIDE